MHQSEITNAHPRTLSSNDTCTLLVSWTQTDLGKRAFSAVTVLVCLITCFCDAEFDGN